MSDKQEKAKRIASRIESGLPEEKWPPHWHWNDKVRNRISNAIKAIKESRNEQSSLSSS